MSQETVIPTTPLLMVCSSASYVSTPAMMAPLGSTYILCSEGCGSATTADAMGHKGCFGLTTVLQQLPQSPMPLQVYANHANGPPQVSFSCPPAIPAI